MPQGIILSVFGGLIGAVIAAVLAGLALMMLSGRTGKKRLEEPEKRKIALGKDNGDSRGNGERKKQMQLLASLRMQAKKAEAEAVYSQFFGKIGEPVQKLLALAEEKEKTADCERILREEIQLPLREAVHMFHVSVADKGFLFPAKREEEKAVLTSRLEKLSDRDIAEGIRNCRERMAEAERYGIPREAINSSAVYLHKLIEIPAAEPDWKQMRDLADGIRKSFVRSGIYPLFWDDEKLKERPDLCAMFIKVHGRVLQLPGLFIEGSNGLQLYGNFQGTCRNGGKNGDRIRSESSEK